MGVPLTHLGVRETVGEQQIESAAKRPRVARPGVSIVVFVRLRRLESSCAASAGLQCQRIDALREAEIAQPNSDARAIVAYQNVLWLDIAMYDRRRLGVCDAEPSADLPHQVDSGLDGNQCRPVRSPELIEAPSGDVFHREE